MDVPGYVWLLTVIGIVAMLAFDFVFHVRKAHSPTLKEAAVWSSAYVGLAILFGLGVWILGGQSMGTEYFAGACWQSSLRDDAVALPAPAAAQACAVQGGELPEALLLRGTLASAAMA